MSYLWHIRWALPAGLGWLIAWQTFFSTGVITAVTDFTARTKVFEVLQPAGRVTRTASGIVLQAEPVYVDVRIPPRTAAVTLKLQTAAESAPLQLGVKQGNNFEYLFKGQEMQGETVRRYSLRATSFPYLEPGRRLRFIISAPKLKPGDITVTGAEVEIVRQGLTWSWLKRIFTNL
jgi:hypothetical protein